MQPSRTTLPKIVLSVDILYYIIIGNYEKITYDKPFTKNFSVM